MGSAGRGINDVIEFDLTRAHPDFRAPIETTMTALLWRYPRAKLRRVYVGEPRNPSDISMGFFDEKKFEIWFNSYWFSQEPSVLQRAAESPPLFHGKMIEEPRHVCTHEMFHAIEVGTPGIKPRMKQAWLAATRDPSNAPAGYSLVNETEFFAELGACVEMGLATVEQRAQLKWIIEG